MATFDAPSTMRASTGKLVSASPHQSSVRTRMLNFSRGSAKTARSSAVTCTAASVSTNLSLLVVIWSRYC